MCSCARRILLVATICIARVIFWVLRMLAIFARISLVPAMSLLVCAVRSASVAARPSKLLAELLQALIEFRCEIRVRVDRLQQVGVRRPAEVLQRGLECLDTEPVDLVHVAVVHGID